MHIVKATVPGSSHVNPGQPGKSNNQDAIAEFSYSRGTVIVLADGCGSQPHSSTGADIGSHLVGRLVREQLLLCSAEELDWEDITAKVALGVKTAVQPFIATDTQAAFERAIVERFLFTAIVLVTDGDNAVVGCFGDGVIIVDNDIEVIRPPLENSPPYIGYLLCSATKYHQETLRSALCFRKARSVSLSGLRKGIIVATDGFVDILDEDFHHPALVQPKSLQRWLNMLATEEVFEGKLKHGKCRDDVSVVMVRSDEAQASLLALREGIVELKHLVRNVSEQISAFKRSLDSRHIYRSEARQRFAETEKAFLELLEHPLAATELTRETSRMSTELRELSERSEACGDPPVYVPPKEGKQGDGASASFVGQVWDYLTEPFSSKEERVYYSPPEFSHSRKCVCTACIDRRRSGRR